MEMKQQLLEQQLAYAEDPGAAGLLLVVAFVAEFSAAELSVARRQRSSQEQVDPVAMFWKEQKSQLQLVFGADYAVSSASPPPFGACLIPPSASHQTALHCEWNWPSSNSAAHRAMEPGSSRNQEWHCRPLQ